MNNRNNTGENPCLSCDLLKNVTLLFDDEVVGGCVEINTASTLETKGINEYLTSEPYGVVSTRKEYIVNLKLIGNHTDYSGRVFDLKLRGEGFAVTYSNCHLLSDREYSQDGMLYRAVTIGSGERSGCCE